MALSTPTAATIDRLTASAFTIPTDHVESDGTLTWSSTTLVLVEAEAGGVRGLGYTYSAAAAEAIVRDLLAPVVQGRSASSIAGSWAAMVAAVRNVGRPGVASCAISAVDGALWDLKAKLLDVPLATLLGQARESVPVYASGGFTSYSERELREQAAGWAEAGIRSLKIKVGREPSRDTERVRQVREAIGPGVDLLVDANGAYSRKQALVQAEAFGAYDVSWFEEPVSSDDLAGLVLLRNRAPAGMEIAAGEYGYDLTYFRRMLSSGAVDVLQADATRCAGITGFLQVGALCEAFHVPLSSHTAPALHVAPCCALSCSRHIEYFYDHARIERMLFDGVPRLEDGCLQPDLSAAGLGITFKRGDAERFRVS